MRILLVGVVGRGPNGDGIGEGMGEVKGPLMPMACGCGCWKVPIPGLGVYGIPGRSGMLGMGRMPGGNGIPGRRGSIPGGKGTEGGLIECIGRGEGIVDVTPCC
jgi:hypothetical protein